MLRSGRDRKWASWSEIKKERRPRVRLTRTQSPKKKKSTSPSGLNEPDPARTHRQLGRQISGITNHYADSNPICLQVRVDVFLRLSVSCLAAFVSAKREIKNCWYTLKDREYKAEGTHTHATHTHTELLQVKVWIFHRVSLRSEYKRLKYNDTGEDRSNKFRSHASLISPRRTDPIHKLKGIRNMWQQHQTFPISSSERQCISSVVYTFYKGLYFPL